MSCSNNVVFLSNEVVQYMHILLDEFRERCKNNTAASPETVKDFLKDGGKEDAVSKLVKIKFECDQLSQIIRKWGKN